MTACNGCGAGQFLNQGKECEQCLRGEISTDTSTACSPCLQGHYANAVQTDCIGCPCKLKTPLGRYLCLPMYTFGCLLSLQPELGVRYGLFRSMLAMAATPAGS